MRTFTLTLLVLLATTSQAGAQLPEPRLARVGVVESEGRPPVLEVVANAPLAFNVLRTGRRLDVRIYGVEPGLVPLDQRSTFGRIVLVRERRGNVVLRLTPLQQTQFNVTAGVRPNVIEITPR